MAGLNGKTAVVDQSGRMFLADDASAAIDQGYRPATDQEFAARQAEKAEQAKYGTAGQQALGLAEKAVGTGTFGLVNGLAGSDEDVAARKRQVEQQSPVLSFGAEALGLAPAAALASTGVGALAEAGLVGAEAAPWALRGARAALTGTAAEAERIRSTDQTFDPTNAFINGVAGEAFDLAVASPIEKLLGNGADIITSGGARAERAAPKLARGLEQGADREAAFAEHAPEIIEQAKTEAADSYERARAGFDDALDVRSYGKELESLAPEQADVHGKLADDTVSLLNREDATAPAAMRKVIKTAINDVEDASDPLSLWRAMSGTRRDLEQFGEASRDLRDALASSTEDQQVFGKLGELQGQLNRAELSAKTNDFDFHDLLSREPADATEAQASLRDTLDAFDQVAQARRALGLKDSSGLRTGAQDVRDAVADATEAQGAQAARAVKEPAGEPELGRQVLGGFVGRHAGRMAGSAIGGAIGGVPGGLIGHAVGGLVDDAVSSAIAGKAGAYTGLLGKMTNVGQQAVSAAARRFAQPVAAAMRTTARGLDLFGIPAAATAASVFTGQYPSLEASYTAKTQALRALQQDPTKLPTLLGRSMGDLPETHPEAFQRIAGRIQVAATYLLQNMPAGSRVSLLYPDGTLPSQEAQRQFAVLYNSVVYPNTVLRDVANGTAVPQQTRALAAVHPEMYATLKQGVITQISRNPTGLTHQKKLWLDLMFQLDGAAGPSFSWAGAAVMRQPNPQTGTGQAGSATIAGQIKPTVSAPRSLRALSSGPTSPGA